jgi:uncharacterized protein Smg (DUF494 family)
MDAFESVRKNVKAHFHDSKQSDLENMVYASKVEDALDKNNMGFLLFRIEIEESY